MTNKAQFNLKTKARFCALLALQERTLNQFAAKVGAGPAHIGEAMRGRRTISAEALAEIARQLGPEGWRFVLGETDTLKAPPITAPSPASLKGRRRGPAPVEAAAPPAPVEAPVLPRGRRRAAAPAEAPTPAPVPAPSSLQSTSETSEDERQIGLPLVDASASSSSSGGGAA